jgi:hypothetical protein
MNIMILRIKLTYTELFLLSVINVIQIQIQIQIE